MKIAEPYDLRFIRDSEAQYVSQCWHASRGYADNRHGRLMYVVRQFIRKYPQYEDRRTAVYKDICGILEGC